MRYSSADLARVFARAWGAMALGLLLTSLCQAGRIGFVVSEYPSEIANGDSYVITIDELDTERLAHARALVEWIEAGANLETAPDGRIVYTDMAAGANSWNRNVLAPNQPLWSWHPVGEVSFVDITVEIYDGWPTFIEQDVAGWIANTGGAIGFWSYTITQELGVVPEPTSLVPMAFVLGFVALRSRRHTASKRR